MKRILAFVSLILFGTMAHAQISLAASSDAVAFHYNNEWTAASHTTESVNFLDWGKTKANHLFLDGHEFLASTENLQIYAGGLTYQPDLSSILKKTNFSSDNLAVNFSAAVGNGLINSGTTSKSNISFLAGGQMKYKTTDALTWNAGQFLYERVGSKNGWSISTGLAYIFGQ
jgi:hypothetical protein